MLNHKARNNPSIINIKTNNHRYIIDSNTNNLILSSFELACLIDEINSKGFFNLNLNNNELESICIKYNLNFSKLKYELARLKHFIDQGIIQPQPQKKVRKYFNLIDKQLIDENIANVGQIIIQVTERCNLNCKYCIDGDYYREISDKEKSDMSFDNCAFFIKSVLKFINSNRNYSQEKKLHIGFYGGEPLLNFSLIKKVVDFTEDVKDNNITFQFSLTTNGVLLDKYLSFLIKNKFIISISLDGNKLHNSYRKYKNGKESYNKIYRNLIDFRDTNPDYFKDNVEFLSVIHDRNSDLKLLYEYFIKEFKKIPRISFLVENELVSTKKNEFQEMESNFIWNETIYKLLKSMGDESSDINLNQFDKMLNIFSKKCSSFFDLFDSSSKAYYPTDTCLPFQVRIYLTTKGLIYPCERVAPEFIFGKCMDGKFEIFYDKIKQYYDSIINKSLGVCNKCYFHSICTVCFFCDSRNIEKLHQTCFVTQDKFKNRLTEFLNRNEQIISTDI